MELRGEKKAIFQSLSGKKNVLEIGCGQGDFAIALSEKNPEMKITGVDMDEGYIRVAKKSDTKNRVNFVLTSLERFASKEKFDVIIASEVIEHINNIDDFMKSIQGHSKRGTILIMSSDNAHYIGFMTNAILSFFTKKFNLYIWKDQDRYYPWNQHYYNWTINTLGTVCACYGFNPYKFRYTNHGLILRCKDIIFDAITFFLPFFRRKIVIWSRK
jgi:cyclopropane fatty-acyl-phospholipid synthase-like methyltransferase